MDSSTDRLEDVINDSFNELNSGLLSKKEIIGVLLVDSFQQQLYPQRKDIKKEIVEFLSTTFTSLSISHSSLNYLILNNNNHQTSTLGSKVTSSTNSPTLLSHNNSFNTLSQFSLDNNNTTQDNNSISNNNSLENNNNNNENSSLQQKKIKIYDEFLPRSVNKTLRSDIEFILDHNHHDEMIKFHKRITGAETSKEKSQHFQAFHLKLVNSNLVLPSKYSHLITSNNYAITLYQCVEYYIFQNIFHNIFPICYDKDVELSKRIESLSFIEPSHLGLTTDLNQLGNALKYVNKLNSYQTPLEKKRCISKMLIQLISVGGEDYLLPMVIYLLLKSNPHNLWSTNNLLELYSIGVPDGQDSIYDSFVTTFSIAIQMIEKLDHTHLSIDRNLFYQKLQQNNSLIIESTVLPTTTNISTTTTATNSTSLDVQQLTLVDTSVVNSKIEDVQQLKQEMKKEKQLEEVDKQQMDINQLESIKVFRQMNRRSNMVEILLEQLNATEVEELMLKFITTALISQNYYSSIRSSLKRFFIEFLGVKENNFCVTEMEIIGSLQDSNDQSSLVVLPHTNSNGKALKAAKIAGAAVTGAVIVGLTGGLAAPFVGSVLSAIGAGGLVTGLTTTTGLSGATMLSVIFGAAGAKVSADKMISVTSDLQDYCIHKVKSQTSLHAIVYIDGFTAQPDDTTPAKDSLKSWENVVRRATDEYGDIFLVEYEKKNKQKLQSIIAEYQKTLVQTLFKSAATNIISQSLAHALIPLSILKVADVLDNPWSMLKDRSEKAGKILAQQIIDGNFGKRPLTLVGTGMGARMVFYCLEELDRLSKANNNLDMCASYIEMVVFIGAPIPNNHKRWINILNVVSGRVVNCYSAKDVVLKYVCRSAHCLSDGLFPVSGVSPVHIASSPLIIENVDVSNIVKTHLDYEKEAVITKIIEYVGINKVSYCPPKIPPIFSGIVYNL
ncbi:transmembrane protein [Heterostelium album PN500]|uniref:Transmembrane protein n=1 Tax=Heterostelium pallidum (strain ATCC 26659 / Pp 5 / PN500) TaxID=670386 RepID=D3BFI7_HETP5|nr:transmembrane protein [Heterostelium album PN500]EFA79901.1 transmembrane protein [Heterostelium album PN500]|eukprot:XP_020432022.1 transmembrane protein [Heterostelium album PN500]